MAKKRILTQLCRILSGKPTTQINPHEFNPAIFQGLFKTQTLRLITTWDFCDFGRGEMEKALGLDRKTHRFLDAFPPTCRPSAPTWFEIEDDKIRNDDGTVSREPQALWIKSMSSDHTGQCYFISTDDAGSLRCVPLTNDDFNGGPASFRLSRLTGALFALNEMPSVVSKTIRDNVAIPPILRDEQPQSAFSLFSATYLRREFSDAIKEIGERRTLDISGRRFHYVRGHWMTPHNKTERVWRRFHWRGDAELGVVRKVIVAK